MHFPAPSQTFNFHGSGREYFKIWIINLAFTIATLGIYAAWAKVRTRRYFYQATELNGTRFDYHANPKAILKGNLLVAAVILTYVIGTVFYPVVAGILILVVTFSLPILLVKSLRFHMSNSSYSNLRFRFHGTVGSAYARLGIAFLITALCVISIQIVLIFTGVLSEILSGQMPNILGVLLSFVVLFLGFTTMATAFNSGLRMFIVNNTQFGSAAIHSKARFKQFNLITLKTAIVAALVLLSYAVLAALVAGNLLGGFDQFSLPGSIPGTSLAEGEASPVDVSTGMKGLLALGFSTFIGIMVYLLMFAVAVYLQTAFNNLIWNNAELENGHRFESNAKPMTAAGIHFSNWILIILTLGLFLPFARIRSARYRIQHMVFKPAGSIENIVRAEQDKQKAFGDSMSDALGLDLGL